MFICNFCIIYIVDYHLQYTKGIDPQITGLILMLTPLSMAISTFFAGRLSDKFNPRILASSGSTLAFISLIILAFIGSTTTLPVIILAIILEGIGYGMFISPNTNIVMNFLPDKFASIASATVSTTRVIEETLSLGMLTVTFAIIIGSLRILPQYFHLLIVSSKIITIVAAIGCLARILVFLIGVKINLIENKSIFILNLINFLFYFYACFYSLFFILIIFY